MAHQHELGSLPEDLYPGFVDDRRRLIEALEARGHDPEEDWAVVLPRIQRTDEYLGRSLALQVRAAIRVLEDWMAAHPAH